MLGMGALSVKEREESDDGEGRGLGLIYFYSILPKLSLFVPPLTENSW